MDYDELQKRFRYHPPNDTTKAMLFGAIKALDKRTHDRQARGVEGTEKA